MSTHSVPTRTLWDVFDRKAAAIGATVLHAADAHAAVQAILDGVPGVVATDTLIEQLPALATRRFVGENRREGSPSEVAGLAQCAVAETGSLLVCSANEDRAMAMLADRLCLVVHAEAIVASLDDGLLRAGELIAQGNRYATFMSGPSRTADIERTLTIGVHGPGALLVIVLGDRA